MWETSLEDAKSCSTPTVENAGFQCHQSALVGLVGTVAGPWANSVRLAPDQAGFARLTSKPLNRARVARPVALPGEIEVEQSGDRAHEGPIAFADHDAPPVPRREAVLLEPQHSVGRSRLQRRRVGAVFGRDGVDIDLEIAHDALDNVAPHPVVGAHGDPADGREATGFDLLGVGRRGRRVLHVALRQRPDRAQPNPMRAGAASVV